MSDINTMRDAYEHWTAVGASDEKQAEARRKFDAILAAHDAEKRAEWEAEQGDKPAPCVMTHTPPFSASHSARFSAS